MRSKPIWLKTVVGGLLYIVFSLSIIYVEYIVRFPEGTFVLGSLYGVILALITSCESAKRTVIARFMGLYTAYALQEALALLGVPYWIILYVLRNDAWVRETGRLTVNEVIGYNFGRIFFWFAFLISFAVSGIGILIFNVIRNRVRRGDVRRGDGSVVSR